VLARNPLDAETLHNVARFFEVTNPDKSLIGKNNKSGAEVAHPTVKAW